MFDQAIIMDTYVDNVTLNLRALVGEVAEKLAVGDLEVSDAAIMQDGDQLGQAFQDIVTYMIDGSKIAESIARGDLTAEVQPKSERDVLGNAFAAMVTGLSGLISRVTSTAQDLARSSESVLGAAKQGGETTAVPGFVGLDFLANVGAWPDEAHVTPEDIDQLR